MSDPTAGYGVVVATRSNGRDAPQTVRVAGHQVRLTHLDKVMYPATGTTKADVIAYYSEIAPYLLPHVADRPVTRKRWVDGVGTAGKPGDVFFEKNLPDSAPSWIRRATIEHRDHRSTYPVFGDAAALVWAGQVAALELHVPQWTFARNGRPRRPDRFVLDLDPGPGVGLTECVEVAKAAKRMLRDVGLDAYPVTSGSKGLHLYAALDRTRDSDTVNAFAKELARTLESELPDLVISSMRRKDRGGKVFVDWSQNNGNKTTVAPYSLRGTLEPQAAVPRTWRELNDPALRQLTMDEVLARMRRRRDPMAALAVDVPHADQQGSADRLATYRSKRDATKTPEPVPSAMPGGDDGTSFVIQEHHASSLHWDFRLEHDGVLVSWALPKGVPTDVKHNHLAVQTEDHPLEYGTFEGTIPRGEYGGGVVTIWDTGTYELEKWRDDEVIATLSGTNDGGLGPTPVRLALIRTGKNWLIHRMKDQAPPDERPPSRGPKPPARDVVEPMLATLGSADDIEDEDDWAFEMKWDGIRSIAVVDGDRVRLTSRNGKDQTDTFPEVADALAGLGLHRTVLDGEVVAWGEGTEHAPDFGRLQRRMGLTKAAEVERARREVPVAYLVFDILRADGDSTVNRGYDTRREALLGLDIGDDPEATVRVPPAYAGDLAHAVASSKKLGLEGVVAKRRTSRYRPGKRGSSWVKIKHHRTQEVVIGGWRPGNGSRSGGIGSLLLGIPDGGELRYVGRVGSGFTAAMLDDLSRRLSTSGRKTSPFASVPADVARDAHWVTPRLVGEVDFAEWTSARLLRQPAWRGLRNDKKPADVRPE